VFHLQLQNAVAETTVSEAESLRHQRKVLLAPGSKRWVGL